MDGLARGRGRDAGKGQAQAPAGRRPGNGNGGGRPGSGQPGTSRQPQGAWQAPADSQAGSFARGSSRGSQVSAAASSSGAFPRAGPRYSTPTVPGADGRGTAYGNVEAREAFAKGGQPEALSSGSVESSNTGSRGEAQRGAMRGRRIIGETVRTKPQHIVSKKGSIGKEIALKTNYFRVLKKPTWSLYQYRVDFSPEVAVARVRNGIIFSQKATLGGYIFDGTVLFITHKLPKDVFEFMTKDRDDKPIQVVLKYVGECEMTSASSLQVLNLILRRAMNGLKLQLVGRNFFDALAKIDIREFNIQLWPGYVTSIRQHEMDILLCAEITNKVMRTETIHDIMSTQWRNNRNQGEACQAIEQSVIGMTVLTDYTNKTYRIDEIDFNKNPQSTFETKDGPISFASYYKQRYNITIRDLNQPLLLSKAKERDLRGGGREIIALIPELCRATGLTDQMKSNFQLTRAMSEYTRMAPDRRIQKLLQFNQRLARTEESMAVLNEMNLQLDAKLVELPGRLLGSEEIVYGSGRSALSGPEADWTKVIIKNTLYASIILQRWTVIFPPRAARETNDFIRLLQDVARGFKLDIDQPKTIQLNDDRQNSYTMALDKALNDDIQLLMVVVPNNNADRYSNIKKKCCLDRPIPTQVLVAKTITPKGGNVRGLMSVATKVFIQLQCKLGGAPWMIKLPLTGLMTVGFDVCHDTRDKRKSYGAMVATMDLKQKVKYFSAVSPHTNGEELCNEFTMNMTKALREFRNLHQTLPQRILIYRDGVGEGQTNYVFEHEVKNIIKKLESVYADAGVTTGYKMAFVIVSKRINTRIFQNNNNPLPGTIVDDVITLPERYDFFLVSQSVRQGTVSPTSYNVIHDNMGLGPDKLQLLTYKQTHMYYNCTATTRVPAVCQYAHKLALLVGQYIHQSPSHILEKDLYFL